MPGASSSTYGVPSSHVMSQVSRTPAQPTRSAAIAGADHWHVRWLVPLTRPRCLTDRVPSLASSATPIRWPLVVVLASLGAVAPVATDLYLPGLPAMGESLDAGPSGVQLTLTAFLV